MSVYKIFILFVFNRECMERNVLTSFQILSSIECFLRYFETRITTIKSLCQRGWKMKSFIFSDNDFGTSAFLFGQSCLCVTFTSWSNPSFGMLLSKLPNRNTHVCTSNIRMISFFYPSVWIIHTLQCFK